MGKPLLVQINDILAHHLDPHGIDEIVAEISEVLADNIGTVQERLLESLDHERSIRYAAEEKVERLQGIIQRMSHEADGDRHTSYGEVG